MLKKDIDWALVAYRKVLEATKKEIKRLETMTPDEDKPVEYSCYTVVFNEWKVCVDQRLTTSELEAVKSCQKHYWIVELNRILVFTSVTSQCIDNTLNNILIVQDSKPF